MATQKIDPKVIFASNAPAIDKPPVFSDKTKGWDVSRANNGRPRIKEMNKVQQDTDLKILWLNENSVTPHDASIDYPNGAVTIKDGTFKQLVSGAWVEFLDDFADKDKVKRGIANRYDSSLTYNSGERVVLANGDIVKSTIDGSTNDPNVDMTGWLNIGNTSKVESIAELLVIPSPKDGNRVHVKGYRVATNLALMQPYRGGGDFIYVSSRASENDGIAIFNGWLRQDITELTPEMAGAYGDGVTDDADALILCITKSYELGLKKAVLGAYTYRSSKELPILCGNSYYRKGVGVVGQGKDATYIKFTGSNGFRFKRGGGLTTGQIANGFISDMTIENLGGRNAGHIGITGGDNLTGFSARNINFINWTYATKFDGTFYICSFLDLFASTCLNGFHTGTTGTTLHMDRCYVQGGGDTTASPAPAGFKINAAYSHIGALACDNYAGTSYDFDFGGGFAASLGIERSTTNTNPNASMFKFTATNWTIGYTYMLNTKGLVSTNKIFDNTGSAVNILCSRIHENDSATTTCEATYSRVFSIGSAAQKARTTFNTERLDVSFAEYNPDKSTIDWRTGSNLDGVKYIYGNKRPFIGLYDKQDVIDKKYGASLNMSKTSLWFDVYGGSFRYAGYSGTEDYQFNVAPLLGDWGIQRRPDVHGIAAVVNTFDGASIVSNISSAYNSIVPLINYRRPSDPVRGSMYQSATGLEVHDGTNWTKLSTEVLSYIGTYDPPSIVANSTFKHEVPLVGSTPLHYAQVAFGVDNSDIQISCRAGTDVVYVYFTNISAAVVDLSSSTLKIRLSI